MRLGNGILTHDPICILGFHCVLHVLAWLHIVSALVSSVFGSIKLLDVLPQCCTHRHAPPVGAGIRFPLTNH